LFFFLSATNACCYNLTKDSIVWKTNILDEGDYVDISFHPIIVENKYVLFQYESKVSCVDFSTGKLIWKQRTGGTYNCPILYYEGKVIVRPFDGNVSCYDVHTGTLLWKSDLKVGLTNLQILKMDAYKGNLYLLTGRSGAYINPVYLHCLSMETGKLNWFDPGPDKGIYDGLTIDQQTGYLYCNSTWSVLCIDLNKTPKK
jgi:outer membrane protein assembly factor BamB